MTSFARIFPLLLLAGSAASGCKSTPPSINGAVGGAGGCAIQYSPSSSANIPIGLNDLNNSVGNVAQSFEASQNLSVSDVALTLMAIAPSQKTVVGSLVLSLESDNNGVPSGNALESASLSASTASSTAFTSYDFHFQSPVELVQSNVYWLVLSANYGASSTSYVEWAGGANPQSATTSRVLTTVLAGSPFNWVMAPVSNPTSQEMAFGVGCT